MNGMNPPGHGGSVALRETTRRQSLLARAEAAGLPPFFAESFWSCFLTGGIPTGAFANRAATPAPRSKLRLKNKCRKRPREASSRFVLTFTLEFHKLPSEPDLIGISDDGPFTFWRIRMKRKFQKVPI
jgi:hypothetical protein